MPSASTSPPRWPKRAESSSEKGWTPPATPITGGSMLSKPDSALVIVGHGSTVNPDSSAPTFDHAEELIRRGVFGEVYCCFWKEEPSCRQVFHMVDADDIYVVPNFISEGYFTRTVIPRELELSGPVTRRGNRVIKY